MIFSCGHGTDSFRYFLFQTRKISLGKNWCLPYDRYMNKKLEIELPSALINGMDTWHLFFVTIMSHSIYRKSCIYPMISALLLEYVHQMLDRDNINFLKIVGQKNGQQCVLLRKSFTKVLLLPQYAILRRNIVCRR